MNTEENPAALPSIETMNSTACVDDSSSVSTPGNSPKPASSSTNGLTATTTSLSSDTQAILGEMFRHLGNQSITKIKAQRFPSFSLTVSYGVEESNFKKSVKCVSIDKLPRNANVIGSHVIYKLKLEEDKLLKLKSRIAPHGNEDVMKDEMRRDCSMCSPVGLRILLSIATIKNWSLTKLDVRTAFLQTGKAGRDVYVITPRESNDRGKFFWFLLSAAYGFVNTNAKWQVVSDELLIEIGFEQISSMPQLFMIRSKGELTCLLEKIVDDNILSCITSVVEEVTRSIDKKFEVGHYCPWTW